MTELQLSECTLEEMKVALTSDDPVTLTIAAEFAGQRFPGDLEIRRLIANLLEYPVPLVREGAILGLMDNYDDEITVRILKISETDNSRGVRDTAIDFLDHSLAKDYVKYVHDGLPCSYDCSTHNHQACVNSDCPCWFQCEEDEP